jgi:hypothetical protein
MLRAETTVTKSIAPFIFHESLDTVDVLSLSLVQKKIHGIAAERKPREGNGLRHLVLSELDEDRLWLSWNDHGCYTIGHCGSHQWRMFISSFSRW